MPDCALWVKNVAGGSFLPRHDMEDQRWGAPLRVLVAGEDRLARVGLVCLLNQLAGVEVAGETTDLPTGKALDRVVAESRADVVIRGPVHALPPSRSPSSAVGPGGQPRFATIVLSDTETLDDVETAFACGADAFLVESRAPEQLAAAVSAVAEGRRFLDPEVGARLAADAAWGHARAQGGVTQRERQVLALIAAGKTTGEIAKELGISPRTVEGHRMRVGRKLGLRRRAELIEYALVHGLRPRRPASANSTSR